MKNLAIAFLLIMSCSYVYAADSNIQSPPTLNTTSPTTNYYEHAQKNAEETHQKNLALLQGAMETHEKNLALLQRTEKLVELQEENQKRYEKILSTWEQQQAQYQSYLDSLKK